MVSFENRVFHHIKGAYPQNWEEDYLTHTLMMQMRDFFHFKRFRLPGDLVRTRWKLYQLNDPPVNPLADAVLLFSILYHDGTVLEGAAYIMARKKDPDKNTFSTLRKDQLKKLHSVGADARLLLYDYDPITGMAFPSVPDTTAGTYPHSWDNWVPYTHVAAVPSSTALALGAKTTGLYKTALPLSYQLCFRWFFGLDIEYGPAALETAKGNRPGRGTANFLACVSVSHGGAEPTEDFDFNRELYSEMA